MSIMLPSFQKMKQETSTLHQKEKMSHLSTLIHDAHRRIATIMAKAKKNDENNVDFVSLVILLEIKHFAESVFNMYTYTRDDPKRRKKFVSALAQTSLTQLRQPLKRIETNKKRIAAMSEDESEAYAESLKIPLSKYLFKKRHQLDELKN
jgi:uncharacterized UBP type Zn finger protein